MLRLTLALTLICGAAHSETQFTTEQMMGTMLAVEAEVECRGILEISPDLRPIVDGFYNGTLPIMQSTGLETEEENLALIQAYRVPRQWINDMKKAQNPLGDLTPENETKMICEILALTFPELFN